MNLYKILGNGTKYQFLQFCAASEEDYYDRWIDKSNNLYEVRDDSIAIMIRSSIDEEFLKMLKSIPNGFKIIIEFCDKTPLSSIKMLFDRNNMDAIDKKVVLDFSNYEFNPRSFIDLDKIPENVEISNTNAISDKKYFGDNSFDYYLLNLNHRDFMKAIDKLDTESMARAVKLRKTVDNFCEEHREKLGGATIEECADFVFDWCNKSNLETGYYRKGCVSFNRAAQFKKLLNNYYMGINCRIVAMGDSNFFFNEVVLPSGKKLYYDTFHKEAKFSVDEDDIRHFDGDKKIIRIQDSEKVPVRKRVRVFTRKEVLERREKKLKEKEEELKRREEALEKSRAELEERTQKLDKRESDIKKREGTINKFYVNPYLPYNGEATYHLTRSKIVQDLAVSSTDRSRYSGVMSSKDIEASQKKIGAYHR